MRERERDTEREREREIDGSDVIIVALKLATSRFRRALLQLEFGSSKTDELHSEQSETETRKTAF